ncbi:MAG: CPBP family intramembrane glutamic endopeptidase [Peptococcaceae bacterium]|nr:CPBP family intramembrane glutamic endopeptidase [Peptococcaceae bacterium]
MMSSLAHRSSLAGYDAHDGVRALILYVVFVLLLVVQGRMYTTMLPLSILASLNVVMPMIALGLTVGCIVVRGERWASIGITWKHFGWSCACGVVLAGVLVIGVAVYQLAVERRVVGFGALKGTTVFVCLLGAVNEELGFRGYIETRLSGLIGKAWVCSLATAILFLLIHYPIYWGLSGVLSFSGLTVMRGSCILILHFFCDGVYRRTHCIWGAVVLHWLYNLGSGLLTVQ